MPLDLVEILPPQLPAETSNVIGATNDHEAVEAWLSMYPNAGTKRKYQRIAEQLLAGLTHGLAGATKRETDRLYDALKGRVGAITAHGEWAVVRSLFGFLERGNYILKSPVHLAKLRKPVVVRKKKALSEASIKLMIGGATNQRDKVMVELLFAGGLRAVEIGRGPDPNDPESEINMLTWGQIHLEDGHAIVRVIGKGSKIRTIKLPPRLTSRLMALKPDDARDDDSVFTSSTNDERPSRGLHYQTILRAVNEARANAGISRKVTPHMLRHSHATVAEEKGKRLTEIRDSLGHADINTTMGYIAEKDGVMIGDVFETEND